MCISPHVIRVAAPIVKSTKLVSVPCNHCYECVRKRKLDWEIRLTIESSVSAHTYFGMLTYNDFAYHSDVNTKEIQYYIKRLRYNLNKYYPGATLKYFVVSEYGELKDRLHYHVLYMVSEEFDDTHREFEELCKLSWVRKVPLSKEDIRFRRSKIKDFRKIADVELRKERLNWCRRKYDDISIGFATCQALKHGSGVGSIHYACKYIQKQYNRMFYSRVGYRAWRNHEEKLGNLRPRWKNSYLDGSFSVGGSLYISEYKEYPTFPIRGKCYPVPARWLLSTVGKYETSRLRQLLSKKLATFDKAIDMNRVESFWYNEPERNGFLKEKDLRRRESLESLRRYTMAFNNFKTIEKEWQMYTIPRRELNCLGVLVSTSHTETPLPLKWDS